MSGWSPDDVGTVDAVVVGSGPGGSTAAEVLTEAGWSVVVLERGRNHLVDPEAPYARREHFSSDELKLVRRGFLGPDPLVEPRTFRRAAAPVDREWVGAVNDLPATVGGGGTHADGKLPRLRPEDFQPLSSYGPMPGADLADWPVQYDELEPFYAEAERSLGVSGLAGANPHAGWRSTPYPMPPAAPMATAVRSAAAATDLGYSPYPAPSGVNSVEYDGRPACRNCGHCASYGCPIHAKGDPVAPLQRALRTGRLRLWSECHAALVTTRAGRATGVDYVDPNGQRRHVAARHVVLAGGAMETPRLALLSDIGGTAVGRHVMFHFQTLVMGALPYRTFAERGRDVTHVHDDAVVCDRPARAAAAEAGLPWLRGGMAEHTGSTQVIAEALLYGPGPGHAAAMRDSALRGRIWGFCLQGEDLPLARNRVDLDPDVRDVHGLPVPRVTHAPHQHELVASAHHGERHRAVMERMGAQWVVVTSSPAPDRPYGEFLSPISHSRHVMGTMRMGTRPASSVTDPFGRLHDVPNVVVADASVFPSSAGYGPTLTLVALALRAARALAGGDGPLS